LIRCSEDNEADGGVSSPTASASSDANLYKLIESEKFAAAMTYYKANKEELTKEIEDISDASNDVYGVLNLYCKKIIQDRPGGCYVTRKLGLYCSVLECFIMTNQEGDLADIFGRLFQVSAAVADLESVIKNTAAQLEKATDSKI
jgi:hypothetical protein